VNLFLNTSGLNASLHVWARVVVRSQGMAQESQQGKQRLF